MPAAWSCSISLQTAASVSSVIASGAIAPSGHPAGGVVTSMRRAGSTDAGLLDPRRVHPGAVGEHQRVPDVLDLLDPAAEHRQARLVVHRPVPGLGDELRVALVASERVDAAASRPR